jgi:hypothetical protein
MARLFDRVKETTTSTGTGNITLAGAATRYKAFSQVFSVGDEQIPYCIEAQSGSEWEVGLGTYSASNTLRRDKVYASSNSDSAVNFSAGTKDVFVTGMAEVLDVTGRKVALSRGYSMP